MKTFEVFTATDESFEATRVLAVVRAARVELSVRGGASAAVFHDGSRDGPSCMIFLKPGWGVREVESASPAWSGI